MLQTIYVAKLALFAILQIQKESSNCIFLTFLFILNYLLEGKKTYFNESNRNLSNRGLSGSIPSQLLSLSYLQNLWVPISISISIYFEFHINSYLSLNYWNCPIPDYSLVLSNDHLNVSSECRNHSFFFLFFFPTTNHF